MSTSDIESDTEIEITLSKTESDIEIMLSKIADIETFFLKIADTETFLEKIAELGKEQSS